jgi:outer membrane lipoprotein carrier protein
VTVNRSMLTLCTCLLAFALPSRDVMAEAAREQLDAFSAGLDTLQARFSQRVVNRDGLVEDESEGRVWLSRPNLFRWAYGGEFPELVVADGEKIWIYDESLEQITVRDQALATVDSPLSILTQPDLLDERFEVREAGDDAGLQLLELRARDAEMEFERLLLGLRDATLELLIVEDAFGLRTEFRFWDVERNPRIDPGLFRFTPPPGVDVIGALPGLSQER